MPLTTGHCSSELPVLFYRRLRLREAPAANQTLPPRWQMQMGIVGVYHVGLASTCLQYHLLSPRFADDPEFVHHVDIPFAAPLRVDIPGPRTGMYAALGSTEDHPVARTQRS
jgi:hypothetical protein